MNARKGSLKTGELEASGKSQFNEVAKESFVRSPRIGKNLNFFLKLRVQIKKLKKPHADSAKTKKNILNIYGYDVNLESRI